MASIKLKHSGGNGTILNSPAANPSSDVTLKLPSTTGSAGQVLKVASANHSSTNAELEFATGAVGIDQIDTWYVTSGFNGTVDPIQNNLARFTSGGGYLGSGMSVSSGIWTFPSTGFWLIIFEARSARVDAGHQSRYQYIKIASTTDNNFSSTDNTIGFSETGFYDNYSADYRYNGATATAIFDCTNTSTHKIKFETDVEDNSNNGVAWGQVYFKFIKLGDT